MIVLLTTRVFALLVAGLTLAFLALDLTANRELFLPADVALGVLLIGAALLPNRRAAALGMLIGFAYTAGGEVSPPTASWKEARVAARRS